MKTIYGSFIIFILVIASNCMVSTQVNVGINNDGSSPDPSAMLDVKSAAKGILIPRMTQNERNLIIGPATGLLIFQTDQDPGFYFNVGSSLATQWQKLKDGTSGHWMINGDDIYYMAGNVGIGEQNPSGKLHVSSPGEWLGVIFTGTGLNDLITDNSGYNGTGPTSYAFRIQNSGPAPNLIEKSIDGGTSWSSPFPISPDIDAGYGVVVNFENTSGHTYGDRWDWIVNESFLDALVVKEDKIGIGTNSPNYLLSFGLNNAGINSPELNSLSFHTNGSERMRIASNGYVGIGATAPLYLLSLGWDGTGIHSPGTNALSFHSSNIERIRINSFGHVGIGTQSPVALLHTFGVGANEGNILHVGEYKSSSPGFPPESGPGTRMMWYPDKAVFRAGTVSGDQWDRENLGSFSTAFGKNTIASGDYSIASGFNTTGSGNYSTALGYFNTASGNISTALGSNGLASGNESIVLGSHNTALGIRSVAIGYYAESFSKDETVIGSWNTVYAGNPENWILGDRLFVLGNGTASDARSNAMTVLKNGNIGIGTDVPESKLSVGGIGNMDYSLASYAPGFFGIAVYGKATESMYGSQNYGAYFESSGHQGYGVYGIASYESDLPNYGGYFQSNSQIGSGVFGKANGINGFGVYGIAQNPSAIQNFGGYFTADGAEGRGIYGAATLSGNVSTFGGYFESSGDQGTAVFGHATSTSGYSNTGGKFIASGEQGIGVSGEADNTGTNDFHCGGTFEAKGPRGFGVIAVASHTGEVVNTGGSFEAKSSVGIGVSGYASHSGNVLNYGGHFTSNGEQGVAIFGHATSTSSRSNIGGQFIASGEQGIGVSGEADNTGTNDFHCGGTFEAKGPRGFGVIAVASHTGEVVNVGGSFEAKGSVGIGVSGHASKSGEVANIGGQFIADGDSGIGIYGETTSATGTNYGVYGKCDSPDAYAGYFSGRGYFSGKLGIGVASPQAKLHVETTGTEMPLIVEIDEFTEFSVHANGGISVGILSLPPTEGILANGHVEPYSHKMFNLGADGSAWDNVYHDDLVNQGASAFQDRSPANEILYYPPLAKSPGSFDYKTERGDVEMDPASMPPGLAATNGLLIDEIALYNYKTNYEQQVIINQLFERLQKLEEKNREIEELKTIISKQNELIQQQSEMLLKRIEALEVRQ